MTGTAIGDQELQELRSRVTALEAEIEEQAARANATIAAAQRRMYWLDRLDLDLNAMMEQPLVRLLVIAPLKVVRGARRERGRLRRALRR